LIYISYRHPINPPTTIPLVEIIGAPWTDKDFVDLAIERYRSIGMEPIRLKKEVDGFVVNRLQYAILSAALQLVQDGVAEPEDVDRAVTHGLACRWSFMGPFQTIDLNAPKGIIDCKVFFLLIQKKKNFDSFFFLCK